MFEGDIRKGPSWGSLLSMFALYTVLVMPSLAVLSRQQLPSGVCLIVPFCCRLLIDDFILQYRSVFSKNIREIVTNCEKWDKVIKSSPNT